MDMPVARSSSVTGRPKSFSIWRENWSSQVWSSSTVTTVATLAIAVLARLAGTRRRPPSGRGTSGALSSCKGGIGSCWEPPFEEAPSEFDTSSSA